MSVNCITSGALYFLLSQNRLLLVFGPVVFVHVFKILIFNLDTRDLVVRRFVLFFLTQIVVVFAESTLLHLLFTLFIFGDATAMVEVVINLRKVLTMFKGCFVLTFHLLKTERLDMIDLATTVCLCLFVNPGFPDLNEK